MNLTAGMEIERLGTGGLRDAMRFGANFARRCRPLGWLLTRVQQLRAPIDFESDWREHEHSARTDVIEFPAARTPAGAESSVAARASPIGSLRGEATALTLCNGRSIRVRPVRPPDAEGIQDFVRHLSDTSRRLRFFAPIRELAPAMLARLTGSAHRTGPVLVAEVNEGHTPRIVALADSAAGDDDGTCELALVVADRWHRLGLGRALLGMLIQAARDARYARAVVDVLHGNDPMVGLSRAHGFAFARSPHGASVLRLVRDLQVLPSTGAARSCAARMPWLGSTAAVAAA